MDPESTRTYMGEIGGRRTLLHDLAEKGVKEIMYHPEAATLTLNALRETPLHLLAKTINKDDVLKHPEVGRVRDSQGLTPLHLLARSRRKIKDIEKHPDMDREVDQYGKTPRDYFNEREEEKRLEKEDWDKRNVGGYD